jgi:tRNA nucleotidyltransferase/poly(A) polymerase
MSDYNFLMESRLSPEQYAVLTFVSRLAAEQGFNLYLVGGAVRDLTFGQQVVRDLDFAVEGPPQRLLRAIPAADAKVALRAAGEAPGDVPLALIYQDLDEHFSSAELVFSNGVRAELGMCREEIYSRPGQRPEVRLATIFEDLKRRDFAINAMAVSLHPNSRGLLLDPTNGAGDIERRELRALYSRGFMDDPVRIFRLLRLGLRLDFKPDERTERWLDAALAEGAWERLDSRQQAQELAAILHEDQPGRLLKLLAERKLLGGLDKKLAAVHFPFDRFARVHSVLQSLPGSDAFLLNFHCLTEKVGKEQQTQLARKIIREAKAIKLALSLDQDARKLERVLSGAKAAMASQVYNLLSPQPQALLLYLLANTKAAKVQNRIKNFLFKFPQIRASLPRAELQALGVMPGPEFDRILARIFALQLDGKLKSHQQLMKELRQLAGIKEPVPPPPPKKGKEPGPAAAHSHPKHAFAAPPVAGRHGKHVFAPAPAKSAAAIVAPRQHPIVVKAGKPHAATKPHKW